MLQEGKVHLHCPSRQAHQVDHVGMLSRLPVGPAYWACLLSCLSGLPTGSQLVSQQQQCCMCYIGTLNLLHHAHIPDTSPSDMVILGMQSDGKEWATWKLRTAIATGC